MHLINAIVMGQKNERNQIKSNQVEILSKWFNATSSRLTLIKASEKCMHIACVGTV